MNREAMSDPALDPEWLYEARFAAEGRSAARARMFTTSYLTTHRLLSLVDPVRLIVDSFAAVAVVHSDTPFQVRLFRTGSIITLSVEHTSTEPVQRSIEALELGRHRLQSLASCHVAWGVRQETHGARSVWATFDSHHTSDAPR